MYNVYSQPIGINETTQPCVFDIVFGVYLNQRKRPQNRQFDYIASQHQKKQKQITRNTPAVWMLGNSNSHG